MRRMDSQQFHDEVVKPNNGNSGCNLVINAVMAYFFYVYAFTNPDNSICFASDISEEV